MDRKRKNLWKTIIIHYDNGDRVTTRINATVDEIVKKYIDQPRIYENPETGKETIAYGRCVEFIGIVPATRMYGRNNNTYLKRIYSISKAYMERYELCNKIRITIWEYDYTTLIPKHIVHDCAYIGQFGNL